MVDNITLVEIKSLNMSIHLVFNQQTKPNKRKNNI